MTASTRLDPFHAPPWPGKSPSTSRIARRCSANISDKTVDELTLLTFTATASDPDGGAQTKTFTLDPGSPAGANIDSVTGAFTWTPAEAQGPGTYPVTIRVTDNGSLPR